MTKLLTQTKLLEWNKKKKKDLWQQESMAWARTRAWYTWDKNIQSHWQFMHCKVQKSVVQVFCGFKQVPWVNNTWQNHPLRSSSRFSQSHHEAVPTRWPNWTLRPITSEERWSHRSKKVWVVQSLKQAGKRGTLWCMEGTVTAARAEGGMESFTKPRGKWSPKQGLRREWHAQQGKREESRGKATTGIRLGVNATSEGCYVTSEAEEGGGSMSKAMQGDRAKSTVGSLSLG